MCDYGIKLIELFYAQLFSWCSWFDEVKFVPVYICH